MVFSVFFGFFLGFFGFFLGFFGFFSFFSVCFETVCFGVGCFASIPKQRVSIDPNKQKTHPNSLKESIFGYFSENLGLFRFVSVCFGLLRNSSVCFGCFDIGSKHRNKPKQFKKFCFWFHETNRNTTETELV